MDLYDDLLVPGEQFTVHDVRRGLVLSSLPSAGPGVDLDSASCRMLFI